MNPKTIKERFKLLEKAPDAFYDLVKRIEKKFFKAINDFIDSLRIDKGIVRATADNRRKILALDNKLLNILLNAGFEGGVSDYVKNFDEIERLNRLTYEFGFSGDDIGRLARMDFSQERLFLIDDITTALTNKAVLRVNVVKPVRDVLFQSIVLERTKKETVDLLREEILSNDGSNSRLLRYTKQIASDALTQFDGALNDQIRDQFALDGFTYSGSVVKATRQNCYDLVNGSGKYADLAIRKGTYKVADIDKIIARAKRCEIHHSTRKNDCGAGWIAGTTPATFGRNRGGYNCRHTVTYFRLLDEDK